MIYSIKWQWTKENPTLFKTQVEIINSNLIFLLDDKIFQKNKISFYITKINFTDVRLNVYVEEENIQKMRDVVSKYTGQLVLNSKEPDWNGEPSKNPFNPDCNKTFYLSYLGDITRIGIELHKNDLVSAIRKATQVSYQIRPIGTINPKDMLDLYFRQISQVYNQKSESDLESFWGSCGFEYQSGGTEGAHFYYNIVMGIDPRRDKFGNIIPTSNVDKIADEIIQYIL